MRGPIAKVRLFADALIALPGARNGSIHIVAVSVRYSTNEANNLSFIIPTDKE